MEMEIKDMADFKLWARIETVKHQTTQQKIADELKVPYTRISEAVNGHASGRKFREPLIKALGGDVRDFKNVLSDVKTRKKKGS